jgi:outer membrane lipoprotein-sorting protein
VPAVAVVVTGAAIAVSQMPIAQASPALPARTPAQLLAEIHSDAKVPPMTGTVVETTSLGLPQLPQFADPTSLTSLLTGSHTLKVYYQNPQHFRLAVPQTLSEVDVIRDGNTLWQWDSVTNSVNEYTWPKGALNDAAKQAKQNVPDLPVLTPQQAAQELLAAVGKTTKVTVQTNVLVAGEPAYQLVLAPKDSRSLIGQVVIAIDGKYGVPLRVQVFAKGSTSPAFQVGFTQISFVPPASANLQFTPPPGATVTVHHLGAGGSASNSGTGGMPSDTGFGTYGSGWLSVAEIPQSALGQALGGGAKGAAATPGTVLPKTGALGGEGAAVLNALLMAAKPVHGSWGSGTLLTTSLMSVLITNNEIYIGAVKPSVLYAAAGHPAG